MRQLRWGRDGRGKSGGVRVICYVHSELLPRRLGAARRFLVAFAPDDLTSRPGVWRFAQFEVWPAQRQVRMAGPVAALGARAFDALAHLLAYQGRVVSKAELQDAVWPGLVVEENNLTVQVSARRKLLGPAVIATLAGRGYQFVAPPLAAAEPPPDPAARGTGHWLFGRDADLTALARAATAGLP